MQSEVEPDTEPAEGPAGTGAAPGVEAAGPAPRLSLLSPAGAMAWARSAEGQTAIKYTATSVISTVASQAAFILVYGVFALFSSRGSSIFSSIVGTIPSYYLNRNWAWGKSGKSHFWREVAPFWILAVIGLVFSTWGVDFTKTHTTEVHSHTLRTIELAGAYLGSFGILWIGKFIIFNKFLFIDHSRPKGSSSSD